jgi:hypothetical protein
MSGFHGSIGLWWVRSGRLGLILGTLCFNGIVGKKVKAVNKKFVFSVVSRLKFQHQGDDWLY